MRIVNVEVFPLLLPMKQSFSISGGVVGNHQKGAPHVYVKITDEDGVIGWGEARPSHRWSYETIESVTSTIEHYFKSILLNKKVENLEQIHRDLNQEIATGYNLGQPISKAAVDMALHDLIGKRNKKTLAELWFGTIHDSIHISYLISTRDIHSAVQMATEASEQGFQGLDVKIGFDPVQDILILDAIKKAAPDLFLRVDANQGYSLPQAIQMAKQMERIGVDVFEQPLAANNLIGHAELRRKTSVPIALDESIWTPRDLIHAIRLEACDYVVIKVTKMGGLKHAKLCGEIAREAQLGLLGGGLTESSLGLTASVHVFNFLNIQTPVDLNGPFFLLDDPVINRPQLHAGTVSFKGEYGIGSIISEIKLQQYTNAKEV